MCRIAADLFAEWQPRAGSRPSSDPCAGPELAGVARQGSDSQGSLALRDKEGVPIEEAVRFLEGGALEERLARHDLSTADLLAAFRQPPFPRYHRVVYDGRAETAKPPAAGGAAGGGGLCIGGVTLGPLSPPGSARIKTGRINTGGRGARGSRHAPLREGVTTAGVPGDAVNDSLQLDSDLRAVGGWRGPYSLALQRDSKEFVVAMVSVRVRVRVGLG